MTKTSKNGVRTAVLAVLVVLTSAGCAGLHPIHGVPLDKVDPCLLQPERPKTDGRTIDLSLLGQARPYSHIVDARDVLGIYIEGVLGDATHGPPVVSPSLGASPGGLTTATVASANLGFPVPVRSDGTIVLPYKPALSVRGLSLEQVEALIRNTYSGPDGLLKAGRDRIFVTLHKPRTVRVLVVRKDRVGEPSYAQPPDYRRADEGRGSSVLVELPAFENDVLHALVASGGLPGPDAEEAVYVMRSGGQMVGTPCGPTNFASAYGPQQHFSGNGIAATGFGTRSIARSTQPLQAPNIRSGAPFTSRQIATVSAEVMAPLSADPFASARIRPTGPPTGTTPFPSGNRVRPQTVMQTAHHGHPAACATTGFCDDASAMQCCPGFIDTSVRNQHVRRIPLNVLPGELPQFGPQDVLLGDGDIVYIESRSLEYFYTAGLLGGGKYPLPRNEDTDLLDAIAIADSQRRVLPTRQIGGVSSLNQDVTIGASKVIIFRLNQAGETVPIKVDLNKLKRDPAKAPIVLPGDRIVLQYSKLEAIAASFERHFLDGTVLGVASGVTFGGN